MPAVLVECGFMSNNTDREALITEKGRDRIASDLYDAFRKYKQEYDGVTGQEPEPQKAEAAPAGPLPEDGILYGTQVLVSSRDMAPGDPFFKGRTFQKYVSGKYFKYVVGLSSDLEEAKGLSYSVRTDFPDSFLVKIEGGELTRIR